MDNIVKRYVCSSEITQISLLKEALFLLRDRRKLGEERSEEYVLEQKIANYLKSIAQYPF